MLFFLFCWGVRFYKIFFIVEKGLLMDFFAYYRTVKSFYSLEKIELTSAGPPIVYLPFFPFSFFSLKAGQFLITTISFFSYFFSSFFLYRLVFKKVDDFFLFYFSLTAFSFPIIFSLGMGNPIGFVVLSCYGLFVFRSPFWRSLVFVLGGILKLFPFLEVIPFIFIKKEKKLLKMIILVFIFFLVISWLIFPKTVWFLYFSFLKQKFFLRKNLADLSSYNQSFLSTIARFGVKPTFFSFLFLIWFLILTTLLFWYFRNLRLKNVFSMIESGVLLLSFSFLIHPFPWQYYYAVFLPYLRIKIKKEMIKIKKERLLVWWLGFLLLSID